MTLLPEEYHAEYAGALHLKVSGEWSIHPSTAFATLTADPEVMLEVLADLLRAHPECRPRLPKAAVSGRRPPAAASEGAPAPAALPSRPEASKGYP